MYKFVYLEDGLDCPKYVGTNLNIILLYILYYIAYLLTGSMQQSPRWKTNQFSASQEMPPFYGNHSFNTTFTSACHLTLSWAHTSGLIQVRDTSLFFITCYVFTVRGCSHLTQPLSWCTTPCRLSVTAYSIYLKVPCILEALFHLQPEEVPRCGDRYPLILAILHNMMYLL